MTQPLNPFSRGSFRDWVNLFRRADLEQTPGPRFSRNVQLSAIIDDFSHLAPVVLNGSAVGRSTSVAVVAAQSGFELTAPATKTLAVVELINLNAAGGNVAGWALNDSAVWTPTSTETPVGWGPDRLAVLTRGSQPAGLAPVVAISAQEVYDAMPIMVAPGSNVRLVSTVANQNQAWQVSWVELGG